MVIRDPDGVNHILQSLHKLTQAFKAGAFRGIDARGYHELA
jgi:hypothetical protein